MQSQDLTLALTLALTRAPRMPPTPVAPSAFSSWVDCPSPSDHAEFGVGRIHGQYLQLNRPFRREEHSPSKRAFLAGITERNVVDNFAVPNNACDDLYLIRVPEPPGLGGTPSSHGHFGPHLKSRSN